MPAQSANPPELITLSDWTQGVNQQTKSRSNIADQEVFWAENLFPTATGQLRAAWGPSAAIYTAPGGATILRMFFGRVNDTIGPTGLMFLSTGQIDQVQLNPPYTVTTLGAPVWQPQPPQYFASAKVWSPQQVGFTAGTPGGWVIGSPQGLYAWDGTNLTSPGQPAPLWLTGGATTTMPSGLPGIYAMEVWQSRLWVAGKTVISFSAPGNGADFSTADGGGSFGYQGDQLVITYTDLEAAGGFLYVYGDSMINNISNIALTGTGTPTAPLTTVFYNFNIDPQVGQRFNRPVGCWSHQQTMYCGDGIYVLQGNNTLQISQKMAQLYASMNSSVFLPTMAPAHIFGTRWMLCLAMLTDPTGVTRPIMMCWNGQTWSLASQRYNLTNIGTYEEGSLLTPYGTNGTSLYQLFAQPDPQLQKILLTKAYKGPHALTIKNFKRAYVEMRDYGSGTPGVSITGVARTGGGGIPNGAEDVGFQISPGGYDIVPQPLAGGGMWTALDLFSYAPDFAIEAIYLGFEDRTLFGA